MNFAFRPLGDYQTNCCLLWDDDACVVIDPGYEGPDLDSLLARAPVPPQAVHGSLSVISSSFSQPKTASSNVILTLALRFCPFMGPL